MLLIVVDLFDLTHLLFILAGLLTTSLNINTLSKPSLFPNEVFMFKADMLSGQCLCPRASNHATGEGTSCPGAGGALVVGGEAGRLKVRNF